MRSARKPLVPYGDNLCHVADRPHWLVRAERAGSIQRAIQDTSSSAIPGGSVQVVNQSTGVVSDSISNSAGFYSAPGLSCGPLHLIFSAPGMKKYQTVVDLATYDSGTGRFSW